MRVTTGRARHFRLLGGDCSNELRMRFEQFSRAIAVASLLEGFEPIELTLRILLFAERKIRNSQLLIRRVHFVVVANGLLEIADRRLVLALTLKRHASHVIRFGIARNGFRDLPKFALRFFAFAVGEELDTLAIDPAQVRPTTTSLTLAQTAAAPATAAGRESRLN